MDLRDEFTVPGDVETSSMLEKHGNGGAMNRVPRNHWLVGIAILFTVFLAGCGGGGDGRSDGPGLVEFDNRPTVNLTDPLLEVRYARPGIPGTFTATILNDPSASGDIAYDPVLNTYSPLMGQNFLLFGIDYADPHGLEYRAFLDFPLDGSTGGAIIPLDAVVSYAMLRVFVNSVDFFDTVPVLLDLVDYPLTGLEAFDFSSTPLAVRDLFYIYTEDRDRFVDIEVTSLMQEAQVLGLSDFQIRFLVQ